MIVKRNSNFELLRVVAMIMIVLHHFVILYDVNVVKNYFASSIVYYLFYGGGKIGVAIFAMITGYFMVKSKISIKKLFFLEMQVLFYSIVLFIIYSILNNDFNGYYFISSIFPNIMDVYWFYSGYFILYLLIPIFNKLINNISKRDFKYLLIVGFVYFILLSSLIFNRASINGVFYLFFYYFVGSYIRLYVKESKFKFKWLFMFLFSYFLIIILCFFIGRLSFTNINFSSNILFYAHNGSLFVFICSVCLFMFFKGLNITNSKVINILGSVSFGVYLFHGNFLLSGDLLWKKLFVASNYYGNSLVFLIYGFLISIVIYFSVGVLDIIRKRFVEDTIVNSLWNYIERKLKISGDKLL